jgi:hypothetical protein
MKNFIEYLRRDNEGNLKPICGSTANIIIDGRLNEDNVIQEGYAYAYYTRKVMKADGFRIGRGNRYTDVNYTTVIIFNGTDTCAYYNNEKEQTK